MAHPGKPPNIIVNLSDEEIFDLGKKNFAASEDDVIFSLGIKPKSLVSVKANKRWRFNYDKGKNTAIVEYVEKLSNSKDATIQKELAKSVLPPPEVVEEGYEFEIDAPEWFKKGIGGKKGRK